MCIIILKTISLHNYLPLQKLVHLIILFFVSFSLKVVVYKCIIMKLNDTNMCFTAHKKAFMMQVHCNLFTFIYQTLLVCWYKPWQLCRYRIVLDTDAGEYGGHKRLDHNTDFFTRNESWDGRYHSLMVSTELT